MYYPAIYFTLGVIFWHACGLFLMLPSWLCAGLALCLQRWRPLAIVLLGAAWTGFGVQLALQPRLDPALEGKTVQVSGCIEDVEPGSSGPSRRFRFAIDRLNPGDGWQTFPARAQLRWYEPVPVLEPGQCRELQVRLKQPHGYANPGGFDRERWWFQQRVRVTGYVRAALGQPLSGAAPPGPFARLRRRLLGYFATGSTLPARALLQALTVGDRSAISPAQWAVLNATGTTHLLAISGLHISLVAGLVFMLVRRSLLAMSWLSQRIPAGQVAAVFAMAAALAYAELSGFAIPARRAVLMTGIFLLALVLKRRAGFLQALCLAAAATLLVDPLSILSAGWWLSFWAVLVIAWVGSGRCGRRRGVLRWCALQLALAIGMLPAMLLVFQRVSLVAPLANWLAVPVVGMLVVPLALFGVLAYVVYVPFGSWLFGAAGRILDGFWPVLEWLARTEHAVWSSHAPVWWTIVPAVAGLGLLLAPRGVPARWAGAVMLLPMLLVRPARLEAGGFQVTLLDVGQGLSAVVETAGHALVYDTGPAYGEFDTGRSVVVPYLRQRGIRQLDMLVISHGDNDHIGGARSLLDAYPAGTILSSVPEQLPGTGPRHCRRGMHWEWDRVRFRVLHPLRAEPGAGNNSSCVLRITGPAGGSVLLTGDIERETERQLLRTQRKRLPAQVLVVPHHGSNTSSTAAWIRAVAPRFALVPDGYLNRYHFPAAAVVRRYRDAGAQVLETGRKGAITATFGAHDVTPRVVAWRDRYRPYWRWHDQNLSHHPAWN
jgi:competence protein ComEC